MTPTEAAQDAADRDELAPRTDLTFSKCLRPLYVRAFLPEEGRGE